MARPGRLVDVVWAVPVLSALLILVVGFAAGHGSFLYDFQGGLYDGARDVLHGRNPYPTAYLHHQASVARAGGTPQTVLYLPVYPPAPLVATVPLALLPYAVAGVLFWLASAAALVLALRLLDVSDWRCYGLAFASWPVQHGLLLGALTPLLVLGSAVLWRYRSSVWLPASAAAAMIAAKLFPWPLAVWLLVTRRFRAALLSLVLAAGATVFAWAVLGFQGLRDYPRTLGDLSFVSEPQGVSLVSLLRFLGASSGLARALALVAGAALLALAWRLARAPAGERRAFGLAVVAALVASPMVWPHYLALLIVPVALLSPRLSALWLVPLLTYLAPTDQLRGRAWVFVPYLGVIALVGWLSAAEGSSRTLRLALRRLGPAQPTAAVPSP
jgi:alpha-1,2-mannosyltransferase